MRYPKFLKKSPSIYGLGFSDIVVLIITLFIGSAFKVSSLTNIIFCLFMVITSKVLFKYFDLKTLFLQKRSSLQVEFKKVKS